VCCELAHRTMGNRVAKWRAVASISDTPASPVCVSASGNALARRAALSQEQRAGRRARSADGKARSAPVGSPWMRSQPQHYTVCGGTCPALGIVSLSSGRSANRASGHRNAICRQQGPKPRPALQRPPFEAWAGCDANLEATDQALNRRIRVNAAASVGKSSDEAGSATSSTGDPPQRHDWGDG